MIVVITLILALLFLPWPWNLVVIGIAAVVEGSIAFYGIRWTRRRRAHVGVQTMVGRTAEVITTLAPTGQVKVDGTIWKAHSAELAQVGETVRITSVKRLTLEVEPAQSSLTAFTLPGVDDDATPRGSRATSRTRSTRSRPTSGT